MKRLACLDGLRGVLALYVLLVHLTPAAVLPWWIVWPLSHGEAAVDLFFMLSGLVIVRSLAHYAYRARPFLIARAARIFPVFLPVFALAVAVQPLAINFPAMPWIGPESRIQMTWSEGWPGSWVVDLPAHLTLLHGAFPDGLLPHVWLSFLGAAWSLSTEWQFYILVAMIGARFGCGSRGQWRLVLLLLGLTLAAIAWQAVMPEGWRFSRAFLPNKALYFALGVASAAMLADARAWPRFLMVLGVVAVLCLLRDNPLKVLAPLTWVLCLAAQVAQGRPASVWLIPRVVGGFLCSRPLCWLGAISYSLYLVNEPIQKLLGVMLVRLVGGESMLFTLLWLPTAVLIPIGAAWWLHDHIETPALHRGRALAATA